jgi:hypothetical protein
MERREGMPKGHEERKEGSHVVNEGTMEVKGRTEDRKEGR